MKLWRNGVGAEWMFFMPESVEPRALHYASNRSPRAAASFNQGAAANRRSAWQSDGSDNLSAIVATDRAFPAAVAELGR